MSPIDQELLDRWQEDRQGCIRQWLKEEAELIRERRARLEDLSAILELHKPKEAI